MNCPNYEKSANITCTTCNQSLEMRRLNLGLSFRTQQPTFKINLKLFQTTQN